MLNGGKMNQLILLGRRGILSGIVLSILLMNNLKLGFDKVYVISLPRRLDRRERVKRVLNGIDFEFVDSIDGYKI